MELSSLPEATGTDFFLHRRRSFSILPLKLGQPSAASKRPGPRIRQRCCPRRNLQSSVAASRRCYLAVTSSRASRPVAEHRPSAKPGAEDPKNRCANHVRQIMCRDINARSRDEQRNREERKRESSVSKKENAKKSGCRCGVATREGIIFRAEMWPVPAQARV